MYSPVVVSERTLSWAISFSLFSSACDCSFSFSSLALPSAPAASAASPCLSPASAALSVEYRRSAGCCSDRRGVVARFRKLGRAAAAAPAKARRPALAAALWLSALLESATVRKDEAAVCRRAAMRIPKCGEWMVDGLCSRSHTHLLTSRHKIERLADTFRSHSDATALGMRAHVRPVENMGA